MQTSRNIPLVYFVVPCFNEQDVVAETAKRLLAKIDQLDSAGRIQAGSRILFVDDGSTDATWTIIQELYESDRRIAAIKLSRNKGHQNALLAGLMTARGKCDASISLDADLQDDIEAVDAFIEQYMDGCEVVYGIRSDRSSDTGFKRGSARLFYKLMHALDADIRQDHADYRLLSARALDALGHYPEENLFLRGLVTELGFKQGEVPYTRAERFAGTTKYPLGKMLSLAIDGLTSFSSKPLVFVSGLGIGIALLSILGLLYAVIAKIVGVAVPGWAAIVVSIWFLGGVQLFCIGLIGQYVGKVYIETKRRPRYLVEDELL